MNRFVAGAGCLLALSLAAWFMIASSHRNVTEPDTDLEIKKDIDLGIILDSTIPMRVAIPIKNRADRPITVQKLSKDCSCTALKIDKLVIGPGETATLTVVTNLAGKSGLYLSDIVVESDAKEKIDEIQIRGQITGQIRVRPMRATIVTGDECAPGAFTIYCDDQNGKWNYAGFTSEDPNLQVCLKEKESTATTSIYEGTIDIGNAQARPQYASYKETLARLEFKNDHLGKSFMINLPVDIAVRQKVVVDPPRVVFMANGGEQRRTVLLQSQEALRLDAARCGSPHIRTVFHQIAPKVVSVDVFFDPAAKGTITDNIPCDLIVEDKLVGSFSIHIIDIL